MSAAAKDSRNASKVSPCSAVGGKGVCVYTQRNSRWGPYLGEGRLGVPWGWRSDKIAVCYHPWEPKGHIPCPIQWWKNCRSRS